MKSLTTEAELFMFHVSKVKLMKKRISIHLLENKNDVLAGAISGSNLRTKLISEIGYGDEPQPLFLDFEGISVATSSFLREAVLSFRDYCREADNNFYPVVANANERVTEEFLVLLKFKGDAFITCKIDASDNVRDGRILGVLEEKQQVTLDAVAQLKEVDPAGLTEKFKESEKIGVTGWNNRLSSLVAKGLLMETKKGRGKAYRLVLEMK